VGGSGKERGATLWGGIFFGGGEADLNTRQGGGSPMVYSIFQGTISGARKKSIMAEGKQRGKPGWVWWYLAGNWILFTGGWGS